MCKMLNFFNLKKQKEQKAIMQQLMEQKRQEILMRQQEDVAQRNNQDNENRTLQNNPANSTKRRMANLRIPLLRLQGTGANVGEDVGYGLNLGGT